MAADNKQTCSIENRLGKNQPDSLFPIVFSIIIFGSFMYWSLATRIQETGWEYFPATMLDWFAIIGASGLLLLIINGVVGLISLLKSGS